MGKPCNARVNNATASIMPQLTSVFRTFSHDKINVMAIFPSAECKLFHIPYACYAGDFMCLCKV